MRHNKKSSLGIVCVTAGLILVFVLLYQGGRWLERQKEKPETRGDYRARYEYDTLLEYEGKTYREKKNLTAFLVMGIDTPEGYEAKGQRNGGQADFLRVVVLDHERKSVDQIQIDRDTMTPIQILGVLGNLSGVRTAQICLSHGFGDGKEKSCQLTEEAVSNLLLGTTMDFYISMNLDGISVLNDAAGGITVTLEDDFSALDPEMTKGKTLTLKGDQAEIYVRSRRNIGVGTNEARMERQEQYLNMLFDRLIEKQKQDESFADKLLGMLEPYLVTDAAKGRLINELLKTEEYARNPVTKPEGTHEIGKDGFMEFHADEKALKEMIIRLFYEPL